MDKLQISSKNVVLLEKIYSDITFGKASPELIFVPGFGAITKKMLKEDKELEDRFQFFLESLSLTSSFDSPPKSNRMEPEKETLKRVESCPLHKSGLIK